MCVLFSPGHFYALYEKEFEILYSNNLPFIAAIDVSSFGFFRLLP